MAKQIKSINVTKAVETAHNALVAIGQGIVESQSGAVKVKDAFETFRKTKMAFGTIKQNCANALFFRDMMRTLTSPKTGQPYTDGVIANYMSAIRSALKSGKPLELNTSRADAKSKPAAGQSRTPAKLDKEKLVSEDDVMEMADDGDKTPAIKAGAYKSNDDAIAALKTAIQNVKRQCTLAQWKAITILYPAIGKIEN